MSESERLNRLELKIERLQHELLLTQNILGGGLAAFDEVQVLLKQTAVASGNVAMITRMNKVAQILSQTQLAIQQLREFTNSPQVPS